MRYNLGKSLATLGHLEEADAEYAAAAAAADGADLPSYSKAVAAQRSLTAAAGARAAAVASAGRTLLMESSAHNKDASAAAGGGSSKWGSTEAAAVALALTRATQLVDPTAAPAAKDAAGAERAWIARGDPYDLVWLHFGLHRFHAAQGCAHILLSFWTT